MKIKNSIFLIITALIWGTAFVAQQTGGAAAGPYTFNGVRSFIGALVLIPVILFMNSGKSKAQPEKKTEDKKVLILGGISCGFFLFAASTVQQLAINMGSGVGKAGFLTACYILLVPILGLFIKKKCGWNIWVAVMVTLVGLYLLCIKGELALEFCDILLLLCALLFSIHILVVDHFSPLVDGVKLSAIQFFVSGLCSVPFMIGLDMWGKMDTWTTSMQSFDAWIPILYAGVLSCGVAYTFQIIGQKGANPTIASLLMSLESVFSVLAGWLILGEQLNTRELIGCGLIFAAIVLAQIPLSQKNK